MPALYFIVMVGVLVFVHELGHYMWARIFGVRVLRVSLGFGPRLTGFTRDGTEYVISALPLGGYVRMLGENPLDEVRPEDKDRSFAGQSLLRRIVIVVAGPAMNLIFPVLLYFVVFLGDNELSPASIGAVFAGRPAHGQLRPGDRVLAVDGDEISTFYELSRTIEGSAGKKLTLTVQRGEETFETKVTPALERQDHPLDVPRWVGRIGVMPQHPLAVIGVASKSEAAAKAGLQTFDMIVSAAGRPIENFLDLQKVLDSNRGTLLPITYLRPQALEDGLGGLIDMDAYMPGVTALTPEPGKGDGLLRAGLESADLYVAEVKEGSPEAAIGLLRGDRLLQLDGKPITQWDTFVETLRMGKGITHRLSWRRGTEVFSREFRLQHQRGETEHGQVLDRYVVSVHHWLPMRADPPVENPFPIRYAMAEAWRATTDVVELTLLSMVRLVQGRLTIRSLGGPLTIFEAAGSAAREGALNYLTLMAFISINLGLINLFPVPLLDGGHMAFFLIEAALRRPMRAQIREYAQVAGFVFLFAVMILALKNDLERQWPEIVDAVVHE